jgi:hypothetical protein
MPKHEDGVPSADFRLPPPNRSTNPAQMLSSESAIEKDVRVGVEHAARTYRNDPRPEHLRTLVAAVKAHESERDKRLERYLGQRLAEALADVPELSDDRRAAIVAFLPG